MLHGKYRAALVNTMLHMPVLIQYMFSKKEVSAGCQWNSGDSVQMESLLSPLWSVDHASVYIWNRCLARCGVLLRRQCTDGIAA